MSFPLRTLLEIRRRTEEETEQALAQAAAGRAAAELEQRRLAECAAAAWGRARTAPVYDEATRTAGSALAAETFRGRLLEAARRADGAVLEHRRGPLAAAEAAEAAAHQRHATARRDRQAAEQAHDREAAELRRVAENRAEDATSDLTAARRRGK